MQIQVHSTYNPVKLKNDLETTIGLTIRMMMEDTQRLAEPITPKREGTLRKEVTKVMDGNTRGIMRWHVPYAEVQEKGYRINPKTGEPIYFTHYTTPGTHAGFIEEALLEVKNRFPQYLQIGGRI